MKARELVEALKSVPGDAQIQGWQPDAKDSEFFVTCAVYTAGARVVTLMANNKEISVSERILHDDNAAEEDA